MYEYKVCVGLVKLGQSFDSISSTSILHAEQVSFQPHE